MLCDILSLEFNCLDGFSLDGTANPVLLTGSGICDAVGVFTIMQGFQMEVGVREQ